MKGKMATKPNETKVRKPRVPRVRSQMEMDEIAAHCRALKAIRFASTLDSIELIERVRLALGDRESEIKDATLTV